LNDTPKADSSELSTQESRSSVSLLKETVKEFSDDDCTMMAASLSYYTVFSLPPIVFIVIFIAGLFVQRTTVEDEVLGQIRGMIGSSAADQVRTMLQRTSAETSGAGLSLIISIGALLLAATGVFAQLQAALNRAWGVMPDPRQGGVKSFLGKRLLSLGMVLAIGFLLLVSLALSAMVSALSVHFRSLLPASLSEGTLHLVNAGVSFVIFALLFAAIYKWLPDAKITWRDVWVGALGTAILFAVGKSLIGLYLGHSNVATAYGAAGALAVIMVWVYYTASILLLGAEFTQVWARRRGGRIQPEKDAIRVVRRLDYEAPDSAAAG
jgi:membrane protein